MSVVAATAATTAASKLSSAVSAVGSLLSKAKANSYIEYAKSTMVNVPTIVDSSIVDLPVSEAILQSALNQFAVFYIQAATLHMNATNIRISSILGPLNPDRQKVESFFDGLSKIAAGTESYEPLSFSTGLEANALEFDKEKLQNSLLNVNPVENEGNFGSRADTTALTSFKDINKLSIGKVFSFTVVDGDKKADIPITIRLNTGTTDKNILMTLLSFKTKPRGLTERLRALRAGEISFWRDFVACRDLIEETRYAIAKDSSGKFKETLDRLRNNKLAAVLSLEPSIANLAAIYVVSNETLEDMAAFKRVDFSHAETRAKIFESVGCMICAVVNQRWENVTFWLHSIEQPMVISFAQIEKELKNPKSTDFESMLKAFGMVSGTKF